ncbi:MAG TPA: hypothetical protein VGI03_00005 [Verrucomicrobiae bacterium]
MRIKSFLFVAALSLALNPLAEAGQFFQDFQAYAVGATNFSDGSQLFSTSYSTAQVVFSPYNELQLTANGVSGVNSAYELPDLDSGAPVYAFSAKWNMPVYGNFGGSPPSADGFSFNFGQLSSLNLATNTVAQESGYGVGLSFDIQTYSGNSPGFYIRSGTNIIASVPYTPGTEWGVNNGTRHFFEVDWNYYTGMSVRMDGTNIFSNIVITNFNPQGGERFVFAARCGTDSEFIRLDNIAICTGGNYVQLPSSSPYYANNDQGSPRALAFDGDNSTLWGAIGSLPAYDGATFLPSNSVALFAITSANLTSGNSDPQAFTLDGSNDGGGSWNTVGSGSANFQNAEETHCLPVTGAAAFNAYRLNVTGTAIPNSGCTLGELRLYAFSPVPSLWRQTGWPDTVQPRDVACSADGQKVYAATVSGIWASYDGGITWAQTMAPSDNFDSIACSSDGSIVAGGNQTFVMTSTDSGADWGSYSITGGGTEWMDMSANGQVIMCGPRLAISTDGGADWNGNSLDAAGAGGVAVARNGGLLIAAGHGTSADNGIYTSTNSGSTWQPTSAPNANYNGLAASADGSNILAVGYADGIYVSTNAGATFAHIAFGNPWFGASVSADGSRFVLQDIGGNVYYSTDHGTTWTFSIPTGSTSEWLNSAVTTNGSKAFIIGEYQNSLWVGVFGASTPAPVSLSVKNGSAVLSWAGSSSYATLQRSTDLTNWTDVPYPVQNNGTNFQSTDLLLQKAFYRLKSP